MIVKPTTTTDDASVWTWGRNDAGQLGTGNSSSKDCYSPVEVSSVPCSVDSVAAFGWNSFLISSNYHPSSFPHIYSFRYFLLFVCFLCCLLFDCWIVWLLTFLLLTNRRRKCVWLWIEWIWAIGDWTHFQRQTMEWKIICFHSKFDRCQILWNWKSQFLFICSLVINTTSKTMNQHCTYF